MKIKRLLILFAVLLHAIFCFADDETFAERISPFGIFIKTPEYMIEIFEPDTFKTSCWLPGDKLIVTSNGHLINIDKRESARMVDIHLRNALYDEIENEVMDEN